MRKFTDPRQYADYIKKIKFKEIIIADPEDQAVRNEFLKSFYGHAPVNDYTPTRTRYEPVVEKIIERLYAVMEENDRENFKKYFCFSTVETRAINAAVHHRADQNFYAVFINTTLIDLLTKLGKLNVLKKYPEAMAFCNRFPDGKATQAEIEKMRNEYIAYFSLTGLSNGPFITLKMDFAYIHFDQLDVQERFIIFHELGHVINADRMEVQGKRPSDLVLASEPNRAHRKEYFADLIAMLLVLKTEKPPVSGERRFLILLSLIGLFDALYLLDPKESASHPDPIKRLFCICDYYYGVPFTELVHQSYENPGIMMKAMTMMDSVRSSEKELGVIFSRCLSFIFNESRSN